MASRKTVNVIPVYRPSLGLWFVFQERGEDERNREGIWETERGDSDIQSRLIDNLGRYLDRDTKPTFYNHAWVTQPCVCKWIGERVSQPCAIPGQRRSIHSFAVHDEKAYVEEPFSLHIKRNIELLCTFGLLFSQSVPQVPAPPPPPPSHSLPISQCSTLVSSGRDFLRHSSASAFSSTAKE